MQRWPANWPECLTARCAQTTGTGHQRFFRFRSACRWCLCASLLSGGREPLGSRASRSARAFAAASARAMLLRRRDSAGAQLAQLLLTLLDGRLQPCQRLLRSLNAWSASPVGRAAHIKRLLLALFLFQFGTLHSDFFTRLFQLSNGFLSRPVEIAEISL